MVTGALLFCLARVYYKKRLSTFSIFPIHELFRKACLQKEKVQAIL